MSELDIWHLPGAMPEVAEAAEMMAAWGTEVTRDGAGPGSLEDGGLHYFVVDGYTLQSKPEGLFLIGWIRARLPAIVSACVGEPVAVSADTRTAINVNVLRGYNERYELHTDPCDWSAVIFASGGHVGGEWEAQPGKGVTVEVTPSPGDLVIFRGSIPHCVLALHDDSTRISVPVALYPQGEENITRDPALDAHIFGEDS